MKARHLVLACLWAVTALGCGATFDPPTEIKSLRILGVQKDKPYAEPGDDVTLTMLWHDGSAAAEAASSGAEGGAGGEGTTDGGAVRKPQITWLGGCMNPPGDSYSGCLQEYAGLLRGVDTSGGGLTSGNLAALCKADVLPEPYKCGTEPKFTVHTPAEGVLHPAQDPALPLYGLSYVFFALCRGTLAPGDQHFPLRCVDDSGNVLGPDDFVLGYSAIYFFEHRPNGDPYINNNPITPGLFFGPANVTDASCVGDACLGTCDDSGCTDRFSDVDCDKFGTLCMPACPDDGDPTKCPPHDLRIDVDSTTFERDDVTNDAYGESDGVNYGEQMWIDYYSTRGNFHSTTKLLNDATSGYNNVNGTQFYAPKDKGPVSLWVVTHDNRGGVSWVGTTLMIQ